MGDLTVTAAPGKHGVHEVTFVLRAGGRTVLFGGDSLQDADTALLGRPDGVFRNVLDDEAGDPFWAPLDHRDRGGDVTVPVSLIAGSRAPSAMARKPAVTSIWCTVRPGEIPRNSSDKHRPDLATRAPLSRNYEKARGTGADLDEPIRVAVLRRQVARPHLSWADRAVLAASQGEAESDAGVAPAMKMVLPLIFLCRCRSVSG